VKRWVRYGVWALLALPGAGLLGGYALEVFSYGQALAISGEVSALLLLLALVMGAVRRVMWRRPVGVASFGWAVLHLGIYLGRKWEGALSAALEPELLTGWLALMIFLPLAITSTRGWVRKLRGRWRKLHGWVWLAAGLTAAHWWLTAFEVTEAVIFVVAIATLAALRAYRLYK